MKFINVYNVYDTTSGYIHCNTELSDFTIILDCRASFSIMTLLRYNNVSLIQSDTDDAYCQQMRRNDPPLILPTSFLNGRSPYENSYALISMAHDW